MTLTPRLNLRSGHVCWAAPGDLVGQDARPPAQVETAIIGAGIMGAMLAERLTGDGHQVALFDRRPSAAGATAASTALVMWAADTPLSELSSRIGFDAAARVWRALFEACRDLGDRIAPLNLDCGWAARPEVYFAGDVLSVDGLKAEAELRRLAGLPSAFVSADDVATRFGLPARAAIVSEGAFGVDPVGLTKGLVRQALARGAQLSTPVDVIGIEPNGAGVNLMFADGAQTQAGRVILASGYEAARPHLPDTFTLTSSFAIATAPGQSEAWRENAMIWEASDPYLYARRTRDGRLVIGGLDEPTADTDARDALLATKRADLERAASKLIGRTVEADCDWAASFGCSPDGLPAIGASRADEHIWLAYGFGGNGVTFAALAAKLIAEAMSGRGSDVLDLVSPYRNLRD